MKKKGFVLMETIIVIVIISLALLSIFSSYNRILTKLKTENKYDTSEYLYMTKYIRDILKTKHVSVCNVTDGCKSEELSSYLGDIKSLFKVKKVYLLTNINNIGPYLSGYDANIIDYVRKLDIDDFSNILIVEYEKQAIDVHGDVIDSNGIQLKETYIASLEW